MIICKLKKVSSVSYDPTFVASPIPPIVTKVTVSVTLGTTFPVNQVMQEMNCFFTHMTGNRSKLRRTSSSVHHGRKLVSSEPSKADKFSARCIVHRVVIF